MGHYNKDSIISFITRDTIDYYIMLLLVQVRFSV